MFDGKELIGIIPYKVGDKVCEVYHSSGVVNAERIPYSGTVIYVHPLGHYYTVEFEMGKTKVRESYLVRSDINPMIIPW